MDKAMAFVKTSYTKERDAAKAIIRYIQHRPGKDGAKITRTLLGSAGVMTRRDAYRMIDEAKDGTYFYRIIISPDPSREDTHKDVYLREITEQTIVYLSERFHTPILYVATEHTDHAPHRHVHALALLPKTLAKQDLALLRSAATHIAVLQRAGQDSAREQEEREREEEGLAWER
jgi:hypothetical protein